MFKKHLLLVMCLGTYVAAMADGGYNVSYTANNSNENVATITWSESGSSTLQEVINAIGTKTFTSGLKKVKIIGNVSDVTALSGIKCATIDLSKADLPSIISGSFTNEHVKYVVLPNGMAKSDVNTWAKSRFTNLESAASASYITEKQSKWVYDNDVVYEGEVTDDNGTTAKGKINVDVPLAVKSKFYKNGETEYTGTVLVGPENKAYGIKKEENLVDLTAATGYTYTENGSRKEYTGAVSKQENDTFYGYLNPTSTHTLFLNQPISYTYGNGQYAYMGRAYGNVYNALKYILEGGKEVQLTKLENTTYYTYTAENITYIYDGPVTSYYGNIYGNVGGTKVDLSEKQDYTLWNNLYEGVVSIEGEKAYGIQNQNTFQLTSIPENSYYFEVTVDNKSVKYLCEASTTDAKPVTGNKYYYLASDNTTQIVYEGKVYYAQADLETKSSPLGSTEEPRELATSNKYVYTIDGTEYTYTGKVYPENKGFVGGTEYQLTKSTWTAYYYTDSDKKIVYKGDFISDDNYGYVGNNISSTQLTVLTPPKEVNYYEEGGKLVIYSGKVYGTNTAYVGGNEITLDYGTYYKNGDSVYEGMRTADNTKGYTGNDAFLLTEAYTYSYTDPDTEEVLTFTSEQVLTTKTVERIVELTLKEVDVATGKVALTAYVNTPGTLYRTLMNMSVFHDYNGGGWQNYDMSGNVWYGKSEGAYNYQLDNVRDLILSGNLNAVDMNTGVTCVENTTMHYATSGDLVSKNALPSCKPEKIDLSDALFGEENDYHPEDMTISGFYANKDGIKEIILPTAVSQNTIPADFMNNCIGVTSICIPFNYEIIGERAFFNAHGLSHIYTTDPRNTDKEPDNVNVDHGDGSFTFSANLKEIRSAHSQSEGTFFGNAMQQKVFDIYNLAVKAPRCEAFAFQGDLTCGSNGFKGNWTHPICRENYKNGTHVICMLHYPTESKTYTREGGNCTEAENYEDITRVYTLADETGAVDGSGNTRAWPRHEEFWRSYNQAVHGHIWEAWKLHVDETAEYKVVVSEYSEGVVDHPEKKYNQIDYQGWHEFVLTENNIFIPFDPQTTYDKFVEKDWYTICVPYDIKKSGLLMALGVQANGKNKVKRLKKNADGTTGLEGDFTTVTENIYPDVRTLVQVKRSVNERKVTLCLSDKLVTADECFDVTIPQNRQGYEYTKLTDDDPVVMKGGYPYLIRPILPDDKRIKNIGAYVVAVAAQNGFTPSEYTGGIGETTAAGTKYSLPIREGVETQALNKDQSTADKPVYVKLDDGKDCMYNFVGTYLNGNVPQYGYYLGVSKSTGKHQFFRTTKTTTKWNPYSAIIKGFTKPEFTIPVGSDSKTIENVRRTFSPDQADDLIILESESKTLAGKAMTLFLDDSGEDDNTTTAIRDIDTDRNKDNKVYTIGGMLTNGSGNLQKGIYIKNGKKHIVK